MSETQETLRAGQKAGIGMPAGGPARDPVRGGRINFAPRWLQVVLIVALLGSALFVMWNERYLWGVLLLVADAAFGLSFLLRRMVGDDYGRA